MVQEAGNLVFENMVICKVGASSSLIKQKIVYPSANTKYKYYVQHICLNKLIGETFYDQIKVGDDESFHFESEAKLTKLVLDN